MLRLDCRSEANTMTNSPTNRITVCLLMLLFAASVFAQKRQATAIQELKNSAVPMQAPKECVLAFREFFRYLQRNDANIVRDQAAQKRWLTAELRKALVQKLATFTSAGDDPDYPGNGTFIGSWDYPTTYSIVASRRYGKRAVIDVLYSGDQRQTIPATNAPAHSFSCSKTASGNSTTSTPLAAHLFRLRV